MQSNLIRGSAPGKIILHGEHAVVFGKHAIAVSVDLRTIVEIKLNTTGSDDVGLLLSDFNYQCVWSLKQFQDVQLSEINLETLSTDDVKVTFSRLIKNTQSDDNQDGHHDSVIAFLFAYFLLSEKYCNSKRIAIDVKVKTDLPIGAGLGSSAAFSVALVGSLVKAFDLSNDLNEKHISYLAYRLECLFHGKPSGIDNSICTYGGALLFKDGQMIEQLSNLAAFEMIIVYTNIRRNTKKLVALTTSLRQEFPDIVECIMNAIDSVAKTSWQYIKSQNKDGVEALININQGLLNSLGVGHSAIDEVVAIAKKHSCPAKLTGAGGGGSVVIYINKVNDQTVENLKEDLQRAEYKQFWQVSAACKGLTYSSA